MSDTISKGFFPINHNNNNGLFLELKLGYELGGYSCISGETNKRGLYLYITPVEKDNCFTKRLVFGDITGNKILNRKIFVKEFKRKSTKQFDKIDDALDFEKIARLWIAKQYDEAATIVKKAGE